jgi:tRNA modification GTPase
MSLSTDTIAAISSAVGPAARMIVRLAGPESHAIARQLGVESIAPSTASRVTLRFANLACPAWVYAFASPRSYTGEDAIELHIPGNPKLATMLLDHLIDLGARRADPGEFTSRAFFNGRLDLAAAEAVAATISAHSERELRAARQLLAGELSRRLKPPMDALTDLLSLVEVGIDFVDEDVTVLTPADQHRRLDAVSRDLAALLHASARFERLSHEPRFVLVGRPNAGKSTLLNTLAGEDRAVISDEPGTTRDALSARIALQRGTITLVDIAGLEDTTTTGTTATGSRLISGQRQVDSAMQERAHAEIAQADLVLLVRDQSDRRPDPPLDRAPDLVVLTKHDHPGEPRFSEADPSPVPTLHISAHTNQGIDQLLERLDQLAFGATSSTSDAIALSARHVAAVEAALGAIERAHPLVGGSPELLAIELREALDQLGQVLGMVTPDDLLGRIFSRFCIGK